MSNVVGPFPQRKRVRRYRRLSEEQQENEYVERRFATRIARFNAVQRVGCCKKNCLKAVDRSEVEKHLRLEPQIRRAVIATVQTASPSAKHT